MSGRVLEGSKVQNIPNVSLGDFFFNSADKFADKKCQIDASTDHSESFASVKLRSTRVALEMRKRGITSQDVVVLSAKITLDVSIPILASFYLGAKVANLDPSFSLRQTTHLLSLVSPKIIFVEEESLGLIEQALKNLNLEAVVVVFGESPNHSKFSDFDKFHSNEKEFKPSKVDVGETGLILFSSGTTGLPKAICHSHHSFLHLLFSFYESDANFEVLLSFTSFYWLSAMMFLAASFIAGGCRVICSTMEAERVFQAIEKYKVTLMFLAPVLSYKLTNFATHGDYDTSSLSGIVFGGTSVSTAQFCKFSTVFNHSNIVVCYGQTEVGVISMFKLRTDQELIRSKTGSSGKILNGYAVKIVDLEGDKVLGPNQKGEIRVKTDSVMKGYYKTDSSFVFDHDGFIKTGDVGYYDDDECLYIVERIKEMFKYCSWHVVPTLLEGVLLEHPAVKDAVVFGFPCSEEEGEVPTACVVLEEASTADEKDVEEFVAERVSDKEKLRGGVFFVREILRTPSGKLMRKEIRDIFVNSSKQIK